MKNAYNIFARGYNDLDPLARETLLEIIQLFNRKPEEGGLPNFFHQSEANALDLLGYIYEFFLGKFAQLEKRGGEFYTPRTVVVYLLKCFNRLMGTYTMVVVGLGGCLPKTAI